MDVLLLDYNGVIVNDEPLHFASFRDVLHEEGITLDATMYAADYLGLDDRAAFREALRRAARPADPASLARLVRRKAAAYAALAEHELPVVPGVRDFVADVARTARVAVVSGALGGEIAAGLRAAGIAGHVEIIVSADDVPSTKPDPAGFALALTRLAGGAACRAVVIEDSLPGLAAARAIGAGCVMVTTSHPAAALHGADAVWPDFTGRSAAELHGLWRPVRP